jgi:tetratricopeptide (TPR) repeat protein
MLYKVKESNDCFLPSTIGSRDIARATVIVCTISVTLFAQGFFFNSFRNGYHMDDVVAIQKNGDVVQPGWTDWYTFLRHDFWGLDMFSGEWTHKSFRPLTTFTYRLNWLLTGLDSSSFHGTNIILHALVSALLLHFCVRCLRIPLGDAVLTSLLFGLHPVHTESVLYLVGRADVLCACFMLGGFLILSGPANRFQRIFPFIFMVCLAGLSKEIGFMAFPIQLAIELLDKNPRTFRPFRILLISFIAALSFWLRHWYTDGTELKMSLQDNPISFETNMYRRALSYAIVHAEYWRLLVFPKFLCYDYSLNTIPIAESIADVRLLAPLTAYLSLACITWMGLRRDFQYRNELLIAISLFVFSFIPMSNILFPVGTVVGERLLYIPSIGFTIMVVILCPSRVKQWVIPVICILSAVRTVMRVDDWKSAAHLTLVDGFNNPKSSKTQYNLGVQYFTKQKYDLAIGAFNRSIEADESKRDGIAFWRAGQAELLNGNIAKAEQLLVAATTKYGAKLMVREEEIFHDAGVALYHNHKIEKAHYYLSAALTLNRIFPKALSNMGCLLVSIGQAETGLSLIQEASSLKPRNVIYSGNVWIVARQLGLTVLVDLARKKTLTTQPSFIPSPNCVWEFKPAEGGPNDSAMND